MCADRGIPVLGAKGASVHVRSIAAALHRIGHLVTLVAARPVGDNPPPDVARIIALPDEPAAAHRLLKNVLADCRAELVIERYSLESGAARAASRDSGVPLLLEVNAPLVEEATRYRGLADPAAAMRETESLRSADAIHVISPGLARWVSAVAPAVPMAWIPNGVDAALFRDAAPTPIEGVDGPTIGFVGSMKAWHGVDLLLDAFAAARSIIPSAHLLLVGSGPQEPDLRGRAAALGLDASVVFTGHVAHDAVPGLVKRFDVAVAPYLPQQAFYFHPLKVVEYLAAGVPVLYSDQGELPNIVGPAGLAFAPGSAPALASALERILTDADLRRRLANRCAAQVKAHDWDTIAHRVAALGSEITR